MSIDQRCGHKGHKSGFGSCVSRAFCGYFGRLGFPDGMNVWRRAFCGWTFAAGVVLGVAPLRAELAWKETRVTLAPPTGAREASAVFEFTNRGSGLVRITDVRSGCGCTVPELERSEVKPGEAGRVRAVFHVGSRRGRQSVTISVMTDEGRSEPYALTLDVEIKDSVDVAPRLVFWKLGDEPVSKSVRVTLVEDFRIVGVESASADFAVELVPGEGTMREARVTPRDTFAKRQGAVTLKIARGEAEPEEIQVWVRVL